MRDASVSGFRTVPPGRFVFWGRLPRTSSWAILTISLRETGLRPSRGRHHNLREFSFQVGFVRALCQGTTSVVPQAPKNQGGLQPLRSSVTSESEFESGNES